MFFGQEQNQDTISYKGIRSGKVPRNFLKFIKSFLMLFGQQQNQDTNMARKGRIQGKRKGKKRAKLTTCFRTQFKKRKKISESHKNAEKDSKIFTCNIKNIYQLD